jgi:hypothetical protein
VSAPDAAGYRSQGLAELALVFPILPGMTAQVERLAAELGGPRESEFRQSQHSLGVRKERWFLNQTPVGDSVIVYLEAEDVTRVLGGLVSSRTPLDLWLKAEVGRVTGIDFGKPPQFRLPRRILRYPA